MTTTIFDSISLADFLRLTLQAFSRQGYAVEQSRAADADGVLLVKNGARIGILCKKYRGSFIGRPVLQQFHGAMLRLRCTEAYLITTTDCSPEAYEFTAGKGLVPYNRERTTELLRTAFGDAFMRSGTMPELGMTARPAPPAARKPISVASYERDPAADLKKAPVPSPPPEPDHAPREEAANEELPEEVQEVQSLEPPETSAAAPSENTTIIVCWECNQQ